MNKTWIRKPVAVLMAMTMLFSMVGCNKKVSKKSETEKQDTKEMVYQASDFEIEGLQGQVNNVFFQDDRNEIENKKIIPIVDCTGESQLEQHRICSITAHRVYSTLCYVEYYNEDNNEIRISEKSYRISLREWEEQLDSIEFCRINRSTILSWCYVSEISDKIQMVNGTEYRIPAGKKKMLREKYFQYIMKKVRLCL